MEELLILFLPQAFGVIMDKLHTPLLKLAYSFNQSCSTRPYRDQILHVMRLLLLHQQELQNQLNLKMKHKKSIKNSALKIDAKYVGDLVSYLSSNDGKKYSGQIFGVRAKEVFLFQQSRPVFNFTRKER
jgi:hypothetical protein